MDNISFTTYMPYSENWCQHNNKVWFVTDMGNALIEVDLKSKKVKCLDIIPNSKDKYALADYCVFYKNSIFCLPCTSCYIYIYDLEKKEWQNIKFENPPYVIFFEYFQNNAELIMYFNNQCCFAHFSLKSKKITRKTIINDQLFTDHVTNITQYKNKVYGISRVLNKILQYDIGSGKTTFVETNCDDNGFYTINFDEKNIWLTGKNHFLYCVSQDENICKKIPLPEGYGKYNNIIQQDKKIEEDSIFKGIFMYSMIINDCIWFIPIMDNNLLCYNIINDEWFEMKLPNEDESFESISERKSNKYNVLYQKDNRYFGLYTKKNEWVLEIDTLKKSYEILKFDSNIPWEVLSSERGLNSFITWINKITNTNHSLTIPTSSSIGKKIYDLL